MYLMVIGFIVHCIFLMSIFDIYFKSPIINDIPLQTNAVKAPSKRLVLFIADGLRADSFFSLDNEKKSRSPYLRSVIKERGSWGISHTRVPTESRPGHVALIAGFYEDPSAVFKGWKDNPVEFDSLFNRSYVTYAWGSPDILPMFKKGAVEGRVNIAMYSAGEEDFSGRNSSAANLNTWVFDKVKLFFESAKSDNHLKEILTQQGVIFFLHLLGTDVAGHANKPHSQEYRENIEVIDTGVKEVEELITEFYNDDNKTAFVYTSDHGMTDWGSHGAGSASETETPVVVWGAGVAPPTLSTSLDLSTPHDWHLNQLVRQDITQADLVPLIATLLGLSIPVHSIGKLPLGYLTLNKHDSALALVHNAYQLAAQYGRKRDIIESQVLPWLYSPFEQLTHNEEKKLKMLITSLIDQARYDQAMKSADRLIELSLQGLNYYQNYNQSLLLVCISLSFFGWIMWIFCHLLNKIHSAHLTQPAWSKYTKRWFQPIPDCFFFLLHIIAVYLMYAQSYPLQYYVYCCLPVWLWWAVTRKAHVFVAAVHHSKSHPLKIAAVLLMYLMGIELLVVTFFERWVLSVLISVLTLWPFMLTSTHNDTPKKLIVLWTVSSLFLAAFPSLPVIGKQHNTALVSMCGWLWLLVGLLITYYFYSQSLFIKRKAKFEVLIIQLVLFPVTVCVISATSASFDNKMGLPLISQMASWAFLGLSILLPVFGSEFLLPRLCSIGLALAVPFLLLCIGHEAFFLLALFTNLMCWLLVESVEMRRHIKLSDLKFHNSPEDTRNLTASDFHRAFFFLMYIILSFFGTGNVASINSFDPVWVRSFITVFSPFIMTVLILFKTVIPFFLVTCVFRAVNLVTKACTEQLFLVVLVFCDIMGLHFLFAVTNEGSWLDIGTSISHYVIMQVIILFLATLYSVAKMYTSYSVLHSNAKPRTLSGMKFSLESGTGLPDHTVQSSRSSVLFPRKRHVE